jgi:hypothetical protein
MPYKKGESGNPKGGTAKLKQSPVTLRFCKEHYEEAVKMVAVGAVWPTLKDRFDAIMTLLKFEHAEMFGKPKERIDLEMSGGLNVKVIIE